jgi:hypothetical protein
MDHFLKLIAYDYLGLSQSQYWHVRLLGSVSFGPLLGILYLVVFGRLGRRTLPPVPRPPVSLWVNSEGRLISLPQS